MSTPETARLHDLTADDLDDFPEDDGNRYEVIDGDLFVTPAPIPKHQIVSMKLQYFLNRHVLESRLGVVLNAPLDVRFDKRNQVEPDLVYIGADRMAIVHDKRIEGVPDLLVEILSPSTSFSDLNRKLALYERFGVPHYWVASPDEETIRAFSLSADGRYRLVLHASREEVVSPPPFENIAIPLRELWSIFPPEP